MAATGTEQKPLLWERAFQSQALSRRRGHARYHRRGFTPCHAPRLPEKASKHG